MRGWVGGSVKCWLRASAVPVGQRETPRLPHAFPCPPPHMLPSLLLPPLPPSPLPCPAVSLFGLYLLLKYLPDLNIQAFLNAYFWLLGGISMIGAFAPTMRSLVSS